MACGMAAQGHSRIWIIMRCRRFYAPVILLQFYKSFVLSFLEFPTPAMYHATEYALSPLDRVQERVLEELDISEIDAFVKHALAPLRCRRDIAMLGFLHRVARQWAPSIFNKIIQRGSNARSLRSLRCPGKRHSYQLKDPCGNIVTRQFNRSVFGLINIYNLLPQCVVDVPIEFFQRFL